MGFFKNLFGLKKSEPTNTHNFESSTYFRSGYGLSEYDSSKSLESQGYTPVYTPRKKAVSSGTIGYSPEALDFQDEHEREIERWRNKIDNAAMLGNEYENPDKQVSAFEKSIALCDEFEKFCCAYPGGADYYNKNESDIKERFEQDLQNYIDNEYEDVKRDYDKEVVQRKLISSIKTKVMKYVSSNNGVMRKDIYAQFPANQQSLVLKMLNLLISDGRIIKYTHGKKLLYKSACK